MLAISSPRNERALALMRRLGMQDTRRTFAHPALPPGHALRHQALYRITARLWRGRSEQPPVLRQLSLVSG